MSQDQRDESLPSVGPPSLTVNQRLLSEVTLLRQQVNRLYGALEGSVSSSGPQTLSFPLDQTRLLPSGTLYGTFLGPFALYSGETRLSLGHNRPVLELCRYMIARAGQMVSCDELIDLLWPDGEADRAVHRLHVAISVLRRALNGSEAHGACLRFEDDGYSIAVDAVVTDCHLFEQAYEDGKVRLGMRDYCAAATAFRATLQLYKGDYLVEHPYTEWAHSYRVHFQERRLNALIFLSEQALVEGDLYDAAERAHEILGIDNLRERTHRLLMRAHYGMGERACAIRQYRVCAEYLRQELGVLPSQETQCLYSAICEDTPLPQEAPMRL